MSLVTLLDLLARQHSAVPDDTDLDRKRQRLFRLSVMASDMVESALRDLRRLEEYERHLTAGDSQAGRTFDLEVTRTLWQLFGQWAGEAEHVLGSVRRLAASGVSVPSAGLLEDAYGRTRARLSVTPEQLGHAYEQVRQGRGVPVKELRDELRARRGA